MIYRFIYWSIHGIVYYVDAKEQMLNTYKSTVLLKSHFVDVRH